MYTYDYKKELVRKRSFTDGKIEIEESYFDGKLDLVTVTDYRDRTTDEVHKSRESITFIFSVEDDRLQLSRIFANSERGGYALDMKRTIGGNFRATYKERRLLSEEVMDILRLDYPELRIDTRRLRDRIRNLILNGRMSF